MLLHKREDPKLAAQIMLIRAFAATISCCQYCGQDLVTPEVTVKKQ
jgi:hypothetical protein